MNEEIPIANELTTSQKPALEVLEKLGYKKIPSEEENGGYNNLTIRHGDLNQVLLNDVLEKKLNEINSYEYQGKEYNSISELQDILSGTIAANDKEKTRTLQIEWQWKYETGNNENEIANNDKIDTLNAKNISQYTFKVVVSGTQVEPNA